MKPSFLIAPFAAVAVLLASAGPLGAAEAAEADAAHAAHAADAAVPGDGAKVKVAVVTVKGGG